MAKEYTPTRKEVFEEIGRGLAKTGKNIGTGLVKTGEAIKNFCMGLGVGLLEISKIPYIIPTYVRQSKELKEKNLGDYHLEKSEIAGLLASFIASGVGFIGQIALYEHLVKETKHPEIWLVPVATNVASGLYEIGRKMYNNARERVIENHKSKDLESSVSD